MFGLDSKSRNKVALALLVLGKIFGVAGLAVGAVHRFAGGLLLGLDGVFIVAAVVVCVGTMKAREREDLGRKAILAEMMRDGTLDEYLREVRAEARKGELDDRADAP
jgi:hypothetical protein